MILIVTEGTNKGKGLELETKSLFTIGKNPVQCDLVLDDPAVSRLHVKVMVLPNGAIQIEDCNSRNGTIVGNVPVKQPMLINPGDSIRIGDTYLKLINEIVKERPQQSVSIAKELSYQPSTSCKKLVPLGKPIMTIGRDPSNDIVLDHPQVSRNHAKIEKQADGRYCIYDLGSTNGATVNGARVNKKMMLPDNARIQICGFQLIFDGSVLQEYDENAGQMRLEIKNLTKIVADGNNQKTILHDVNFVIEPKEFIAILGGSGAGKSTMMGALSGMNQATTGEVRVNGINLYQNYDSFRSVIGYVPQDDIVHGDLTAVEALTYAARLRMPDDTTEAQIADLVHDVLKDLELEKYQNTLVKRMSGGQRKRVSIGVELLTKPSLFFLDEPTSGLDPGLEKIMMELLRKLALQGRTIVLITHATFNISLCDKVIFLARGGKLAFFGTPDEALRHFKTNDFAEIYKKIEVEQTPEEWVKQYKQSSYATKYAGNGSSYSDHNTNLPSGKAEKVKKPKISSFRQWWTLTSRYAMLLSRDRGTLLFLLLQAIIIPCVIVMVFHHAAPLYEETMYKPGDLKISVAEPVMGSPPVALAELSDWKDSENKRLKEHSRQEEVRLTDLLENKQQLERKRFFNMALCVAIMIYTAILLGASNSAREIVKELPIYMRERLVNLKITPYLFSKIGVLSIICLIQTMLLVGIVTIGLGIPLFWQNVAAFFVVYIASMMMGLAVSALVQNTDNAGTAVILILIPQIILSGAIVPMSAIRPEFMQGIFNVAISKWAFSLISSDILNIVARTSADINEKHLDELMNDLTGGNITIDSLVLGGFILLFYITATVALKRKDQ